MLLYRLKVLLQTGQENCVGPTRICSGDGIQYCPSTSLLTMSLGVGLEVEPAASAVGGPMWRATVTPL